MTPLQEAKEILNNRRLSVCNHPHIKPFVLTAKLKEIDNMINVLDKLILKHD